MKKIPTLFERIFENHEKVGILPNVTGGWNGFWKAKELQPLNTMAVVVQL